MSVATQIREFLRELFGSRMTAHLLEQNASTALLYESRLNDLKQQIADLKTDKQLLQTKVAQLEQAVLPYTSRAGADLANIVKPEKPVPRFVGTFEDTPKTSWQLAQEEFNKLENENTAQVGA